MKSKSVTQSKSYEVIAAQVRETTPTVMVELMSKQLDRAQEAATRVEREGTVVRDMKGSVIPHPGIIVEANATKLLADLIAKFRKAGR